MSVGPVSDTEQVKSVVELQPMRADAALPSMRRLSVLTELHVFNFNAVSLQPCRAESPSECLDLFFSFPSLLSRCTPQNASFLMQLHAVWRWTGLGFFLVEVISRKNHDFKIPDIEFKRTAYVNHGGTRFSRKLISICGPYKKQKTHLTQYKHDTHDAYLHMK